MYSDNASSERRATGSALRLQVRHVRDALEREFVDLLDISDLPDIGEAARAQAFLSRALAALVVRDLTGCDSATAAAAVIDGRDDVGIDAVATDESAAHLWLVQSKWSDTGRASFGVAEALKFAEGLSHIDARRFSRFNIKFRGIADQVASVLSDPRSRITMVPALMRTEELSEEVVRRLADKQDEFNRLGTVLDHRIYLARDIWQIVRNDLAEPPIGLTVKMEDWFPVTVPYEAFHGAVTVDEVARWYDEHGDRLFDRNIRKPLGVTQVNQALIDTLTSEAHNFWYFNNGITVLCQELEPSYFSRGHRSPVELRLQGASIVNGAQTVHAIYAASRKDSDALASGYVGVRVISLKNCRPDFAGAVTTATNTQNRVERRDFVALDSVQAGIKEDFALSLQKAYVVKRGESDPPSESGCSVVTAAIALACAHRNADLAVRAKRATDLLWEEGPQGAYDLLFSQQDPPSAYQIWRSVLVLRKVDDTLHQTAKHRQARAEAIADRGNRLIAHMVFQHLDLDGIDDPDADWATVLAQVPETVEQVTSWLVHHVDAEFGSNSYVASTLANIDRCRTLVDRVLPDMRRDTPAPDLPVEYRTARKVPKRRPNAVPTLIDASRLADGTALTYQATTQHEREAMADWLTHDPSRGIATWINQRSRPLLWSADGKRYSPSGLVQRMWQLAGWSKAPVAAQGPSRWYVTGEGSLWELALATLASLGETANDEDWEETTKPETVV